MLKMETLLCALPEDILRCRYAGAFTKEIALIDRRLQGDIPDILRCRLMLEKRFAQMLPKAYPYSRKEAVARLREADALDADALFTEAVAANGMGLAVMNRLGRAAAFNIIEV